MSLELVGGEQVDAVVYEITRDGMSPLGGAIDTSAPGSTASVELFGLAPGEGYRAAMWAASVDGEISCEGSTKFDVRAGEVTSLTVTLRCKGDPVFGGVRVEGELNVCAQLDKVVVAALQTSQGAAVDVRAGGSDEDGDAVAYRWTATGGSFVDPDEAETTFTCGEAAEEEIKIEVSDDDFEQCVDSWTVDVRCVDSGGTEPSWGKPTLIETDNAGDARKPRLVVDADGNVTALWLQRNGTRVSLYANRYPPGGPWGTPVRVSDGAGEADSATMAVEPDGSVWVGWGQIDGAQKNIYTSRFRAGGLWGAPVRVNDGTGAAGAGPVLVVDPDGNVTIVWQQSGGLYANRYPAGGPWGTPVRTSDGGPFDYLRVLVDPDGNVTVVWSQVGAPPLRNGDVYANRYPADGPWGTPVRISTPASYGSHSVYISSVEGGADGSVVAAWMQDDKVSRRTDLMASRYPAGGPWGGAVGLGFGFLSWGPQLAIDHDGNAMAVFEDIRSIGDSVLGARRYPVGGSWGPTVRINLDSSARPSSVALGVDPDGNVTAVWQEYGGTPKGGFYANRYPADGPWGTAALMSEITTSAGAPRIAVDPKGNVTVLWTQQVAPLPAFGHSHIYASRYPADGSWGTPAPVSNGEGSTSSLAAAVDQAGEVTAVWVQSDGTRTSIWSNRFE